jgi:hypothetical protein
MADWAEQTKANVQPHVDEPVIAVGILQPAGTWGSIGIGQVSRLASIVMRKAANKRAGGLGKQGEFRSQMALVAVTEHKLHAFNAKPWGRQFQVAEPVGAWAWDDLKIETTKGSLSTKVVIDVLSSGEHYELEATAILQMKGHTDAFLAALAEHTSPASATPPPGDDASDDGGAT